MRRRFRSRPIDAHRQAKSHARFLRWFVPLLILLCVLLIPLYVMDRRFRPVVTTASAALAHRAGAVALTEALTNQISLHASNMNLLTTTQEPSGSGDLTVTRVDMSKLTTLQGETTQEAQARLKTLSRQTIRLPLVQMFSGALMSRTTMSIPVRISLLGAVHSAIESDVQSKGVNQVVHILYLHLTAEVMVVTPFVTAPTSIDAKAPVAYIVMAGPVPNTLFNPTASGTSNSVSH